MAATSLEQREAQLRDKLGEPMFNGTIFTENLGGHPRRTKYFYNGKLEEVDGDCYCFSEAVVAGTFRPSPA